MPVDTSAALAGFVARLAGITDTFDQIERQRHRLKAILEYHYSHHNLPSHLGDDLNTIVFSTVYDQATVVRGLMVECLSAFELFFKSLVGAIVDWRRSCTSKFNDFEPTFRNAYLARAGEVLSYAPAGNVNGVKFDFVGLQKTLGKCLTNAADYQLDGQVFTVTLGNCTSERIEKTLLRVGFGDKSPFKSSSFGYALKSAGWGGDFSSSQAAKEAGSELDRLTGVRNDIVHGLSALAATDSDLLEMTMFFDALVQALSAEIVHLST